jgi:glycosyltransferase involved in cell wall biosynthesis
MNSKSLTLCLIVKNEEHFLEKCILSVKDYVQDIIIADTGSTDQTVTIAKKYTSTIETICFDNGFSYARNQVLQKVKTPWVLFLDADEMFEEQEIQKLVDSLRNVPDDCDALSMSRINFFKNGAFYMSDVIRVFRNHPDIFYSGLIVDSIKPSIKNIGGKILKTQSLLYHFGHTRSVIDRNKKAFKYLHLLDQQENLFGQEGKNLGYRALILRTVGKFDEALQIANILVNRDKDSSFSYFVLGHVLRCFNDSKGCIEAYSKAHLLDPKNSLYLNARALSYLQSADIEKAISDLEKAKSMAKELYLDINLGLCYEIKKDFEKALDLYLSVAKTHPAFLKQEPEHLFEFDPFSSLIYDTVPQYKGLNFHIAFCQKNLESCFV